MDVFCVGLCELLEEGVEDGELGFEGGGVGGVEGGVVGGELGGGEVGVVEGCEVDVFVGYGGREEGDEFGDGVVGD